jgi:ribosome maturation factor RimP
VRASWDDLARALGPVLAPLDLELFDVELHGRTLQVTVEGRAGLDLDTIAEASRAISRLLDARDELAPPGPYELEVTSPGLERRLRRPEHFARAVGEQVALRTVPGTPGERRVEGVLVAAGEEAVVVAGPAGERRLTYSEIERARTVFDWRSALRKERRAPARREAVGEAPSATGRRATTR